MLRPFASDTDARPHRTPIRPASRRLRAQTVPAAFLAALMLASVSCTGPSGQEPPAARQAALAAARARWDAAGIHSYTFTIKADCAICIYRGTFQIQIVDDRIGEVLRVDSGSPRAPDATAPRDLFTVPGLFAWIEQLTDADRLAVSYDRTTGAPTAISVDISRQTFDDERTVVVQDFHPSG